MTPQELAVELKKEYGDMLKSVVLYGSAAGGDHSKKFSDFNIICILDHILPSLIARSNRIVRRWVKAGNPPPHFFGEDHIRESLDVFPIEFLDMQERHEGVAGIDPLAGIEVDPKNLRLQCESELKGKLIHLRSFYAANCHDTKLLAKTMVESFPSFMAAFRGLLRLIGKKDLVDVREVLTALAAASGANPDIFLTIADIRAGRSELPRKDEALVLFEHYLTGIDRITTFADTLQI